MKMRIIIAVLFLLSMTLTSHAKSANDAFHSKDSDSKSNRRQIYITDKSDNQKLQELIKTKAQKFEVRTYSDDVSEKLISYCIYFPENYSTDKKYPVVFFIADASCAGKEPMYSVTQGLGALVWTEYECIVIVPTFSEVIIDDHDGFITSPYCELVKRFVSYSTETYSIDESRVYATGQSMGCMTFLYLAAKYTELFTACLFVSGQWNIDELDGITNIPFTYAASYGDDKASKGQLEVLDLCIKKNLTYTLHDNADAKNPNISLNSAQDKNFITFRKGTTLPDGTENKNYSEHMSSFDYAYGIESVREWLLSQTKGN